MIVVADASPIIFLGKIRQLDLVTALLGRDIRIPRVVYGEVVVPGMDPAEKEAIERFVAGCRVEAVRNPRRFAAAMSDADDAALTLAVRCKADFLLCDDRVTRAMAALEGVRPLGTLGILLRARREGILTRADARRLLDFLIHSHNFRISVEVYQAALRGMSS